MAEIHGGRSGRREDQMLDALREVCIERDTLRLEVALLKAERQIANTP